jgi:hypothetical protein
VASGNNNSNRDSTLPLPELNPLLNPVLGAHMGRWAEVYFTSPPEKREEAVLELLRELQGGEAATPQAPYAADSVARQPPAQSSPSRPIQRIASPPPPIEDADAEWIVCDSCGGRNALGNRFCGMCAAPLPQTDTASATPQSPASAKETRETPRETMWGRFAERRSEDASHDQTDQHKADSLEPESDQYPVVRESTFQTQYDRIAPTDHFAVRPEPQPSPVSGWPERPAIPSLIPDYDDKPDRRRFYFGAVVGIVILGLVYVAWKSSAKSDASHALPQAAPTVADTQPTPADQSPPSTLQADAPTAALSSPPAVQQTPAPAPKSRVKPPASPAQPADSMPAVPANATGPIVASLQGNGSEELIVAESYLNGTRGRTRDTSEAAKWLWRSFGKQNGAAALLLSDLYVHGDGVPQSCDQARLLLDAAARKGTPGATQRLTNLPSLGCQ